MDFPNSGEPDNDEREYGEYLPAPEIAEWTAADSENYSRQEMADFIGKKQQYYMRKFDYLEQGNKVSWNWAAFFFGNLWLLHRKMYKYFFVFLVITFVLSNSVPEEYSLFSIAITVVIGLMGNYLYMLHVKEKLKAVSRLGDQRERSDYIRKKGGVNWLGTIVVLAIIILIGGALVYLDYVGTGQNLLIPDETPPWRIR
ncbi:MAG: DUF2628 domain-containing protein [Gracilibacteraceae bacterium]|jgi:hypothetical protein|nr:DUF2628 domain-containing protein [Gracilibacteraceae bacterium]